MEYIVDDKKYLLSYQELKNKYHEFCQMNDDEFVKNIPAALHLACVILYLKEEPSYCVLCDRGIIHELVHLLHIPDDADLRHTRKMFELWLKLA